MRVSRAWGVNPNEVEAWDYSDFTLALEDICETPIVDSSVRALLGGGKKPSKTFDLTSNNGKSALRAEMQTW